MKRWVFSWPSIAVLTLACVLAWASLFSIPDQRLHVSFVAVGEGDAILIRGPSYKVLIDGGPSPQAITGYLGRVLPFWDRRIDLVVSTHPHDDHLMGLVEVVKRYDVGGILASPNEHETSLYREWRSLVTAKGITYVDARRGQEVRLDGEATLEVLHPQARLLQGTGSDPNNNSVVLRLAYGTFSVLLAGDIERDGESSVLGGGPDLASLVLKVPHQGAATSTSQRFLEAVHPRVAVISVGQGNPFGHPAPETLGRLKDVEAYRTDLDGTIEVVTDGMGYAVRTGRGAR